MATRPRSSATGSFSRPESSPGTQVDVGDAEARAELPPGGDGVRARGEAFTDAEGLDAVGWAYQGGAEPGRAVDGEANA